MRKLDRLGWASGTAVDCYGFRIGVRSNDPAATGTALDGLPSGWKPGRSSVVDALFSIRLARATARPGMRLFHLLYLGAGLLERAANEKEIWQTLSSTSQLLAAEGATNRVFVRASVVGWKGRAIVLPGQHSPTRQQGTRMQSELAAAFVEQGATCYSNTYAVLDRRAHVYPYLPGTQDSGLSTQEGLPIGMVVLTQHSAPSTQHSDNRLSLVSPARAMMDLIRNTPSVRIRPEEAMRTLEVVVRKAWLTKTRREEAAATVTKLLQQLD